MLEKCEREDLWAAGSHDGDVLWAPFRTKDMTRGIWLMRICMRLSKHTLVITKMQHLSKQADGSSNAYITLFLTLHQYTSEQKAWRVEELPPGDSTHASAECVPDVNEPSEQKTRYWTIQLSKTATSEMRTRAYFPCFSFWEIGKISLARYSSQYGEASGAWNFPTHGKDALQLWCLLHCWSAFSL